MEVHSIKKAAGSFYVHLKLYTRQRGAYAACQMPGHNVEHHLHCVFFLGLEQPKKKKDMFVICYICGESAEGLGNRWMGTRRGEGKVRNVSKCKDHKFNTFPPCEQQRGRRSLKKG